MSVEPAGQDAAAQPQHSHTHVLVAGNDDYEGYFDTFEQFIEQVLDNHGIEQANFLLPEEEGVSHAVLHYVQQDDNPHTAERTRAPPSPRFALPLAEYAFFFEARHAPQRGLHAYQHWLDAAERHLGEEHAGGWVANK